MEEEKVSLSYDKFLQDVAGNTLEVKVVQNIYDPIGERLVAKMLERVAEDKQTVFKSEVDIGAIPTSTAAIPIPAECVPLHPSEFASSPSPRMKYARKPTYDF